MEAQQVPEWYRSTWICLAGEQVMPNIVPVLAFRPKDVVYLHTTMPASENAAIRCRDFLRKHGFRAEAKCVDPWDGTSVAGEIISQAVRVGLQNVLINWTGGTKPMSLAAYTALGEQAPRLYYDVRHGIKINQAPFVPMPPVRLSIEDHFYVNAGLRPHKGKRTIAACQSTAALTARLNKERAAFLNQLFNYRQTHLFPLRRKKGWRIPDSPMAALPWPDIFFGLQADALVTGSVSAWTPTAAALDYLESFWWEAYVAQQLRAWLRAHGLDHIELKTNLTMRWKSSSDQRKAVTSELDVVLVYDNRLHLISCTTANLADCKKRLEEVETFARHFGGSFGRAMLASTQRGDSLGELRALKTNDGTAVPDVLEWIEDPAGVVRAWLDLPVVKPVPAYAGLE